MLIYAVSIPSVNVALAMGYVMGIGDATAQSDIYVSVEIFQDLHDTLALSDSHLIISTPPSVQPLARGIHPRCTAAASLGGAVAGLAAGLLRMLTKAVFSDDEAGQRLSSSVYFGLAVIIIAVCTMALFIITKYKQELTLAFFHHEHAENTGSFLLESDIIKRSIQIELQDVMRNEECGLDTVDCLQSKNDTMSEPTTSKIHIFLVCLKGSLVYQEGFRCAWLPIIAQFMNFLLMLSLFPGVCE